MNPQDISNAIAAAVSQALAAVSAKEEQPVLSEAHLNAKAQRNESLDADAKIMSERFLEFTTSLGFSANTIANMNTQIGKAAGFSYNSTRAAWERSAKTKAYFENQSGEIKEARVNELSAAMDDMAMRLEENEIISRSAILTTETLYARFKAEVLDPMDNFDQKSRAEDSFLKYNTVEPITEASYSAYKAKSEAKYQQRNQKNSEASVSTEELLRTTERKTSIG